MGNDMTATNQTSTTLQARTLGAAHDTDILKGYLGMCPTCAATPAEVVDEYTASVTPATCPTCGETSVEYGMIVEMDALLTTMNGLDAVSAAIDALG